MGYTYKNQTAELIEGGIAGTVNLRTRLPFDPSGEMRALPLSANYGDLAEKTTPEISGLYSNRWDTAAGAPTGRTDVDILSSSTAEQQLLLLDD